MKPFNLEEAKAGAKVATNDKRKVRTLSFDAKGVFPIVAGDLVTFNTHSFANAETYKGVVEYKYQLGLVVFVNGVQYEMRKALNIRKLKTAQK